MCKNFKIILIIFFGIKGQYTEAQQDAQYSQYMYNTNVINPAYAGTSDRFSIIGLHRSQWVGLEGAPATQTFTLNTPLGIEKNMGLGFSIINDQIGPSKETYISLDYAYDIPLSRFENLSFGIKTGVHLLNIDYEKLNLFDIQDPIFENNIENKFSFNVGAGIYYYNSNFYAGISVPFLIQTQHFITTNPTTGSTSFLGKEKLHYYFITGYVFDINYDLKFKPALLTKVVLGSPLQIDVSANFLFNEKLTLGLAYRWSAALSAMAGFQIASPLMIGFAYDRETTDLGKSKFNDGSFEFILRYELFTNKTEHRRLTPRFF